MLASSILALEVMNLALGSFCCTLNVCKLTAISPTQICGGRAYRSDGGFCHAFRAQRLFAFMASLFILGVSTRAIASDFDNRPIVVIREDDIRSTWRDPFVGLGGMTPLEYDKAKRIPITWGIISDNATSGVSLTWEQLLDDVGAAGGELASHSVQHRPMSTADEYMSEVVDSKSVIEQRTGRPCTTFLQPGTWIGDQYLDDFAKLDSPVNQVLRAVYSQSQAYLGDGWRIGNTYYAYGLAPAYSLDYHRNPSISTMNSILDIVAASPGLVFTVTCHGVQEIGGTLTYHVQADLLKAFMDKLAELRDAGRIRLMGMDDAYHAVFSPDINHVPDSGLEACAPGGMNPIGPWYVSGNAVIKASGGMGDSRYAAVGNGSVSAGGSDPGQQSLCLAPGRYQVSWFQRPEPGSLPGKGLAVKAVTHDPNWMYEQRISSAVYSNSDQGAWEQKTALMLINYAQPNAELKFTPETDAAFGIDDVSIVSAPLDPAVSPVNTTVTVSPSQYEIAWDSPADPDVTKIRICWDSRTHPMAPSPANLIREVDAAPGTRQSATVPVNWKSQPYANYFSVFAVRANSVSPPDLAVVLVDTHPPAAPWADVVMQSDGRALARWYSQDTRHKAFQYQYAVGAGAGSDSVTPWTTTADTSVVLGSLPAGVPLYLSVRAANAFGYWSSISSRLFAIAPATVDPRSLADGTLIDVHGVISAVFGDCFYLQDQSIPSGIKVMGATSSKEGDGVSVSGRLITVHGERALMPDP